jgi:hypothetical protein
MVQFNIQLTALKAFYKTNKQTDLSS